METFAYLIITMLFILLAVYLIRSDKRNVHSSIQKGIEEDKKLIEQLKRERDDYLKKIEDAKES